MGVTGAAGHVEVDSGRRGRAGGKTGLAYCGVARSAPSEATKVRRVASCPPFRARFDVHRTGVGTAYPVRRGRSEIIYLTALRFPARNAQAKQWDYFGVPLQDSTSALLPFVLTTSPAVSPCYRRPQPGFGPLRKMAYGAKAIGTADYLKRAVASLFAFLAAIIIALRPDWLDRPLARTVNSVAARWQDVDRLAFVLAWPRISNRQRRVSALAVLAHRTERPATRAVGERRDCGGPCSDGGPPCQYRAADAAQADLRSSDQPLSAVRPWRHRRPEGDVFRRLPLVPERTRDSVRRIGDRHRRSIRAAIALVCTLLPELSRIVLALHYPADIVGSFAVAAAFAQLAQLRASTPIGLWFVRWERRSALTFYACGLLACYELAGGIQELRDLVAQWPW